MRVCREQRLLLADAVPAAEVGRLTRMLVSLAFMKPEGCQKDKIIRISQVVARSCNLGMMVV